jgi:hypothetical protein
MNRQTVSSSQLHSVGFDALTNTLEIQFLNKTGQPGSVYLYSNVPESVYKELMEAPSVGSYFGSMIKSTYSYTKVS